MYDTASVPQNMPFPANTKKITPGPYRATKLWNEIIQLFSQGMPRRRHRRHLKLYNDCFTASEAIDFLHVLLKQNHNIGNEVTRMQTVQLLRKFYKNHIIEDIQGKWGSEDLHDDNRLYRFINKEEFERDIQPIRKPLSLVNENTISDTTSAKNGQKSTIELKFKNRKSLFKIKPELTRGDSNDTSSKSALSSPPTKKPPLPPIPQCKEFSKTITDDDVNNVWKDVLCGNIKRTLQLDTLDDLVLSQNMKGEWIKHNATKVGKSGVVQVPVDQDLPYWTLSAMTCLANWPNGKNSGLTCYPGFEKDVFKAICDYYCKSGISSMPLPKDFENEKNESEPVSDEIYDGQTKKPLTEPLLTFELYEIFTNIICLLNPKMNTIAIEALKYCLLLVPPPNRRKLHLLLRLMAKVCTNPHLDHMSRDISTRVLLLHTFSRHILSCFEEVHLDELLAMRLVTFLIDHHAEVMKVPENIATEVDEKLKRIQRPVLRYTDGDNDGSFVECSQIQCSNVQLRQKVPLPRSKSMDVMKSLVTSLKSRNSSNEECSLKEKARHRRSMTFNVDEAPKASSKSQHRSSVFPTKVFHLKNKSLGGKSNLKPAQSCPDICDRIDPNPSPPALPPKASGFSGSSRNLKTLINRLRRNKS
ncbi:unnamed protein product [Clavelina lepadiformis]|uniref:DEP domain-containing protein n=1 Tax=Clavelina lepadiformis TaxID=159417 RepID=A0ABP0FV72_CLALP